MTNGISNADNIDQDATAPFARPVGRWSRIPCPKNSATVLHDDTLSPEFIEKLSANPEALLDGAIMLKDGDRSTVVRVQDGSRQLVVKRFISRDFFHSLTHATMRTRARWNIVNSFRLHDAGIGVPSPRAFREPSIGLGRTQSWFVCDFIEGTTLCELKCSADTDARVEHAAQLFADVWQRLDRAWLRHDDLKASNLLLSIDDELQLLDLDGMRRIPPLLHGWYRTKDRQRFQRNWTRDSAEYAIYQRVVFDSQD